MIKMNEKMMQTSLKYLSFHHNFSPHYPTTDLPSTDVSVANSTTFSGCALSSPTLVTVLSCKPYATGNFSKHSLSSLLCSEIANVHSLHGSSCVANTFDFAVIYSFNEKL